MIIKPQASTYRDFPESELASEGMRTLELSQPPIRHYHSDVVYAAREQDGEARELRLQIMVPFHRGHFSGRLPLVVYVQGSSWRKQDLYLNLPQLSDFCLRGYVLAIVEYRESDAAPYPAQVEDVKDAIIFLKENAAEYRIDPERVILWGDSSGGHIALCTAYTDRDYPKKVKSDSGFGPEVGVLIDYYGPTAIDRMNEVPCTWDHIAPDSPGGRLIGGLNVLENPEPVFPAVPMNHLTPDRPAPPTLILHGTKDRIVPFQQSVLLYEALKANGKICEFYRVPGGDHGSPEFWSKDAYDLIERFIDNHLPRK